MIVHSSLPIVEEVAVKPAIKFNSNNAATTVQSDVPPLLRDFEQEQFAQEQVEEKPVIVEQLTIETPQEEAPQPVVETKKERELPAFMRKLFKK